MRLSPVCLNANLNTEWRGFDGRSENRNLTIIAEAECRPAEIAGLARADGALIQLILFPVGTHPKPVGVSGADPTYRQVHCDRLTAGSPSAAASFPVANRLEHALFILCCFILRSATSRIVAYFVWRCVCDLASLSLTSPRRGPTGFFCVPSIPVMTARSKDMPGYSDELPIIGRGSQH
jgi:hypothetical protein